MLSQIVPPSIPAVNDSTYTDPTTGWELIRATLETFSTGRQEIMATWRTEDARYGHCDYIIFHSVKTGQAIIFMGAFDLDKYPAIPQNILTHLTQPRLVPGTRYAYAGERCPQCGRIFGQPLQPNDPFLPEIVNEDGTCWNSAVCWVADQCSAESLTVHADDPTRLIHKNPFYVPPGRSPLLDGEPPLSWPVDLAELVTAMQEALDEFANQR